MRGRVVVVSVALLVGWGSTGCGTTPTTAEIRVGPPTPDLLHAAAGRTRSASTGRIEGRFAVKSSFVVFSDRSTLDAAYDVAGRFDLGTRRSQVLTTVTRFDETGTTSGTSGTSPDDDPDAVVGDTFEHVVDAGHAYTRRTKGGVVEQTDGKEWVRPTPTARPEFDAIGRLFGLGGSGESVDPDALLTLLEEVSAEVTELPREQVHGVEARHLRTSVPVVEVFDDVVRSTGTTVPDATDCTREVIRDVRVTVDVFLDADGFVRRITNEGEVGALLDASFVCSFLRAGTMLPRTGEPSTMSYTTTIDYLDLGRPVTITVPDPAAVTDEQPFAPVGTLVR